MYCESRNGLLAVAEEGYVDVGAEAHVVGQVEAVVVGILVDDDLVGAPSPVVAETVVIGEHAEVETAEPEAFPAASFDAEDMAAAEAAGEVSMLPGMIEMVVGIIAACAVAHPFAVGVDVGSVGVTFAIAEFWGFRGRVCGRPRGSRPPRGNVSSADTVTATSFAARLLSQSKNGTNKQQYKNSEKLFHASLPRDLTACCQFRSCGFLVPGRKGV